MPKFSIITLGCKVNQAESDCIAHNFGASAWIPTQNGQQADVCIVNTCAVTQKACMQSRQAVRKAIRSNPKAKIVVTGCYAQTAPHEINQINGVNYIVGQGEKHTINQRLQTGAVGPTDGPITICGDILEKRTFEPAKPAAQARRTRPFLKIQDGCDAFCTYCIVPYARGRSRSMILEDVLENIQQLAAAGYHEVVLTGIHLGAYGEDLSSGLNLSALLHRIENTKPIERVRLSSIEPMELSDEIVKQVADSEMFCRHFHIPLQSGDDLILKRMGRPYSSKTFNDLIVKINELMPDASVGVDILVGFPGENQTAFENTCALIEKLPISYLHVFPYSPRPGTPASGFADKVRSDVIQERSEKLRVLGNKKRMEFYRSFMGKHVRLLIETQRDRKTGLLKGISSNYLPVLLEGGDDQKNQLVDVKIEKFVDNQLFGILIEER
ncbi:MAG: tRNA (N(6)-L-threonylcarbamoyladenosine(37)-C(2))-methylthiotransferase MtaB [Desulfobacterales bacterium]|jgi:threonylcarbamoyladenosine tRNA methylthiotransferase MtaB